jgi:hydrogenase expression/formation protein HypE
MSKQEKILLAHGGGGKLMQELIENLILKEFENPILAELDDAAVIPFKEGRLALTTDSFVVDPIFFKGGDIGKLAVCGTVNDLAMKGAVPKYLTVGFILEEGLLIEDLKKILHSMRLTAEEAGVEIVAGDTKVVGSGSADKIFINTAGIGIVPEGVSPGSSKARPGDAVLINGYVGDHGIAVLDNREGLGLRIPVESDCAPLNHLVASILEVTQEIHVFRDPTRGGLASSLNEIARQSRVGIRLEEAAIPLRESVRAACDLLGYDPLYVANEGKVLVICPEEHAEAVLARMRDNPLGRQAARIGEVVEDEDRLVTLKTFIGGTRIVDMLAGDQLPRIC